jgi:stage III sporulation protein AE
MRKILIAILCILLMSVPVRADSFVAPTAPEDAQKLMPRETEDFGEGLWFVISSAINTLQPAFAAAVRTCVSIIAVSLLASLVSDLGLSIKPVISLIGTVSVGMLLFQPARSLISLGIQTVNQISQYGKLLLPVLTGALAAQGAATTSGSLYVATAFFDTLLSSAVSDLLVPMVYIFLAVSIVCNLFEQPLLQQISKFIKWMITWGLKTVLYVFTGYISITGVVSGSADASMLKATKLTISGMVPVVGNILSDASEAVLVSAEIMKNAVGVYGLLAVIAMWIGPFLQIGVQYLLLKISSGVIQMFGVKQMAGLVKDFSSTMGLVLAMTGTMCMIFIISTICFMKGVI